MADYLDVSEILNDIVMLGTEMTRKQEAGEPLLRCLVDELKGKVEDLEEVAEKGDH